MTGNSFEKLLSKFTQKPRWVIASILTVLAICIILLLSGVDLDGMLRFPDRLAAFPTIMADYKQISEKVSNATSDVWLKAPGDYDIPLELVRGENYKGCIRGGFSRTYGTNRPYNDVLGVYKKSFSGLDWGENDEYAGLSGKTTRIQLHRLEPSSSDFSIGAGKYQILYTVTVVYADPAVQSCYG